MNKGHVFITYIIYEYEGIIYIIYNTALALDAAAADIQTNKTYKK